MTKEEKKDEMKNRISMALKDPILQQCFEVFCKNLTVLEQQIADIKANCDLAIEGRDVKIMELEQQIEKMKCCGNCRFNYCERSSERIDKDGNRTFHCWNEEKERYCDVGKNGKYQCWELED